MILPLKELREHKGITQFELSRIMNVSPSTVGMWEQGRRDPDYTALKFLANYFNVSTDYLLGNERRQMTSSRSNEDINLLAGFHSLTADGRKILMEVLNSLKVTHAAVV